MNARPAATPSPSTPSQTPSAAPDARERFAQRELDEVLGRYELGEIRAVRELALGGPASPKALVECARGRLLLKRRARGVDAPEIVAFGHELLLAALKAGVCVPPLVGTRDQNNSMVQTDDRIYELFVYIEGGTDPRTQTSAAHAGALLGELHRAFDAARGSLTWPAPAEGAVIDPARADRARAVDPEIRDGVRGVLERAAAAVPPDGRALVHGDWHPGNLIFRGDVPVAACDFDHARLGLREREIAQGLAQFSLTRGKPGQESTRWPAEADMGRLRAHWSGYLAGYGGRGDLRPAAVAALMPGVLMEEAASGADPRAVWVVLRKAQWLEDRRDEIAAMLDGDGSEP